MTDAAPRKYAPIVVSDESTVVAEYLVEPSTETAYQSEADLERELIRILQAQAYDYLPIRSEADLVTNLRSQLERLNGVTFSDTEWEKFFTTKIAGKNDGIEEKTHRIHEDHVQLLERDDFTMKNILLIDKTHIHNNRLQVINQYEVGATDGARHDNRYDVTILVNGLPLVHIELKRRGVQIREAFNQIRRYQRDSFWSGSGLFDYVQLFVISNGTHTKYYSNTTRHTHVTEANKATAAAKSTSNSFEFTSWWADATNRPIQDLTAFARTFFAKHALLNILTRYCVLTSDRNLLVMRPYQIVATERILQRIATSTTYKQYGTIDGGGYIWHTTGSGKTLTSFKAAQLASRLDGIDKVLFVVDRKDLDYQTMREYDRFEKGAANSNTSTAVLARQLGDPNARIIITTIQKLANFISKYPGHAVTGAHVAIIFDECHRSQFGEMHLAIRRAFTKYHLFGFTGTPIFAANAGTGRPDLRTTEQTFGEKLHTYTIVDAINDRNVLPFRVDYINTVRVGNVQDAQVPAIDTENALLAPERLRQIVAYTLEHFDQKTRRSSSYGHKVVTNVGDVARRRGEEQQAKRRVRGFNAIFATASITAAKRYYNEFARQQAELPEARRLKIATIFSYGANEAAPDGILDDEGFDTGALDTDSRQFLEDAIQDYNGLFGTSYDTSAEKFQNYYKDVSLRLKNRELDLVIVVNMFLTGFDATTLNTLFLDKNLRAHGLIQAYSRTNRILNSVKTYGNIVSFRNLEDETNAALELFGNKDAGGIVLLKPFGEYFAEYSDVVDRLLSEFPLGQRIEGEEREKAFIALYGQFARLRNILSSFDEFADADPISPRQQQDYQGIYVDLHEEYRGSRAADRESINDDIVFEIELVKQVEVNVDYILMLVEKYRAARGDGTDREVRAEISRAVNASPTLRDKRDLVEAFVDSVSLDGRVDEEWQAFIADRREHDFRAIVDAEKLRPEAAREFVNAAFREGHLPEAGTAITRVLPPVSRFSRGGGHSEKKARVLGLLAAYFDRYFGLGGDESDFD